ncbi:MFS transporter, partial [Bacteroidota bacterium]
MLKQKGFETNKIITISFAHLVHDVFSSFLAPLLPLLTQKFGISYSLAGFLTVAQRFPSLLNPVVGIVAEKLPVRYFLILAPSVTAVSMSLLGAAPSYAYLIILLFIAGIGASLFHVPAPVMIKRVAGNRLGKGMSFFMLGGEGARSLGPIIILGAVHLWGLEKTYYLIPLGLFCSLILYYRFKDIPISDAFKKKNKEIGIKKTFFKFLPLLLSITGIIFFSSLVKSSLTIYLPIFITSIKGESLWIGGISLSILQLAGAGGTFFSGTIS